jgi:putative transcriptional regulator
MKYHPKPDLLLGYSSGNMEPALAFAIATHLRLCTSCQKQYHELEAIGGDLIEHLPDSPIDNKSIEQLMAKVMEQDNLILDTNAQQTELDNLTEPDLAIASDYVPLLVDITDSKFDKLSWHSVGRKMARSPLPVSDNNSEIELIKLKPGAKVPKHTHVGNEYTVILEGCFSDDLGRFERGDFIHMNQTNHHQPIAGDKGCICLAVTDAPMKFTGILGPVLNWFTH